MTLVDTSAFVEYFRENLKARILQALLAENQIVLHPYVEGELVLGGINPRIEELLSALPQAPVIAYPVLRRFITEYKLSGRGLGLIDCQLLASAKAENAGLFTFDKLLGKAAGEMGLSTPAH